MFMNFRSNHLIILTFWFGYVILLSFLPEAFPPDATLPNVAAHLGYNIKLAYLVIAVWSVFGFLFFAIANTREWISWKTERTPSIDSCDKKNTVSLKKCWLSCLTVGSLVAFIYWPAFLARYGSYIEDQYFMNVLLRMQSGQIPYRDFEFLYGPLMIYLGHYWINIVGYSLQSYYSLLVCLQVSFFIIALLLFQYHIRDFRERYLAFLLFALFSFDSLLGLNYIGWRIMFSILAIMVVSAKPHNVLYGLIAGGLVAIQLAYSYEYGIIALISIIAIYCSSFFLQYRKKAFYSCCCFGLTAILLGLIVSTALTGDSFSDYMQAINHTLSYAQSTGLGNFRFYWTLNSLVLFALLSIAVITVGSGLIKMLRSPLIYGDRLLLGCLFFCLGSLRIAIQRADIWHLTLPFIPLIIFFLWRPKTQVFSFCFNTQKVAWLLIVVAVLTRLIGVLPTTSYFVSGLVNGARDMASGVHASGQISSRVFSTLKENTAVEQQAVSIANFFNQPSIRSLPVVFYEDRWGMGIRLGVVPQGYSFYQLMYTDQLKPMRDFLSENNNTLVVMSEESYNFLYENKSIPESQPILSITKRIGSWLSSIHYSQKFIEKKIKREMWRQNLGVYLSRYYIKKEKFGDTVILERR
ncbi:MAG: hypothetical protein CL865_03505 [Cycloclasticus sp.]|nr:hypothetical protein [Cycloclasticus sp.]HAI97507.1 hypothetical protein [Methylococcaceae bacterium]